VVGSAVVVAAATTWVVRPRRAVQVDSAAAVAVPAESMLSKAVWAVPADSVAAEAELPAGRATRG